MASGKQKSDLTDSKNNKNDFREHENKSIFVAL